MKSLLVLSFMLALMCSATSAFAKTRVVARVLSNTTTTVTVSLNAETVLCSRADYSALFLKVLIPQLSELTVLNHRNAGAGAPCVAAGICTAKVNPDLIINPQKPTEEVAVTVERRLLLTANAETQICSVVLEEEVTAPIRGLIFHHLKDAELPPRELSDCN